MSQVDSPRERLAKAMEARRVALRLQWDDVAERARMSPANLRRLRNNADSTLTATRIADIEAALEWPPGSIEKILTGAAPVALSSREPESERLTELQAQLEEVLSQMSRRDRRRWEAEMRQEEVERLERWHRIMSKELPISD